MTDTPRSRLRFRPRHIVRWVAIVVVLLLVASVVYAVYNYRHFVDGVTHIDAIPATTSITGDTGENILLVGDDHRPANASAAELAQLGTTADGGGTNTDTMMVLHIPSNGAKASLISFPRDSWVSIPGHGMNKLNAAFAFGSYNGGASGGAQLLVKTIEGMSGLHIDHFVRISMVGFYDVAQALGPLQVCLVNAVSDRYSTFSAPAGVSTLNAQQALAFVRQRHGLPRGDLDREVRQRYFLTAELKKFASASTLLNPGKLNSALTAVSGAIETDKGLSFLSLLPKLRDLAGGNLDSVSIPVSGTPTIYSGGVAVSIVQVDTAAMPAFVKSLDQTTTASGSGTTGTSSNGAAKAPAPSTISVTVLNGSGVSGAAATASSTLSGAGFRTATPSTVSTREATTIQYPAARAAEAAVLKRYVPGATLVAVTGDTLKLVLGTDGATARSTPAAAAAPAAGAAAGAAAASPSTAAAPAAVPCIN